MSTPTTASLVKDATFAFYALAFRFESWAQATTYGSDEQVRERAWLSTRVSVPVIYRPRTMDTFEPVETHLHLAMACFLPDRLNWADIVVQGLLTALSSSKLKPLSARRSIYSRAFTPYIPAKRAR